MISHHNAVALATAIACSLGFSAAGLAPATAQDWLKPLQRLAEDIVAPIQERDTARPSGPVRPTPPVVERPSVAPVTPPVPLARPDFEGDEEDAPPVEAPAAEPVEAPAAEPVEAPAAEPVEAPAAEPVESEAVDEPASEAPVEPVEEPVAPAAPVAAAEPARVYQSACPALIQGQVEGRYLPPIEDGQCGNQSPLEITAVLSRGRMVPLSEPVTTDCGMASALPGWVAQVDGYAQSMLDSRLAQINTGPGYMCRNRNGAEGGFLSEHGFANALDVSGFTLEDGQVINVKADWLPGNVPAGRMLRLAHDAACGSFTTVLGPEANKDHEDHLHLDLGCHGASCTALLCE
jgi:hypothetical protein